MRGRCPRLALVCRRERLLTVAVRDDYAYFHLYGIGRSDVEYILTTFQGADEPDESTLTAFRADNLILAAYDRLGERA